MSTDTHALKGVEVFATGTHNGDEYTEGDLDDMVSASAAQGFTPPLKAGHNESPGKPAIGWVENLRRVGNKLVADITHIPAEVYGVIRRRGYDRVSAEVYWNLKQGARTFRRALKAVALLGADVPAVSSLAPLHKMFSGGDEVRRYTLPITTGHASLPGCDCSWCEGQRGGLKAFSADDSPGTAPEDAGSLIGDYVAALVARENIPHREAMQRAREKYPDVFAAYSEGLPRAERYRNHKEK